MKQINNFISKYKYIILLILIYLLFFLQMKNVVICDDDYNYAFQFDSSSFNDKMEYIISNLSYVITNWSDRIITHIVVISGLTFFGINFYRCLNVIFVFLLSYIITKIVSLFRKINFIPTLLAISFLIITLNVALARETLYWASAGIPYIWGGCLLFYFFYYLIKNYKDLSSKNFAVLTLIILLISFVLEQYNFIIVGVLFLLFIESLIKKKSNLNYLYLSLIAIILFLVTYISAGNISRYNYSVIEYPLYKNLFASLFTVFRYLTDKNVCGLYFCFFSFLVSFKMLNFKKKYYLPMIIILFGNIYFLSNYFGLIETYLPFLYDCFHCLVIPQLYNYILISFSLIYFLLYIISIFFCLLKIFSSKNKYMIYIFISTIVSAILPVISLRYVGFRYCLPFLITIFLLIIYLSDDKKSFILSTLFTLLFVNIWIGIVFVVLYFIFRNKGVNFYYILLITIFCILLYNFFDLYSGYKFNKMIHDYNQSKLVSKADNIYLLEIPKKTEIYTWNNFYTDYIGYNVYYTYLNDGVLRYYNIKDSNLWIFPFTNDEFPFIIDL